MTSSLKHGEHDGTNAVTVTAVTVCYDSRPVLSDVSFNLEKGKVLAILGQNGAGKTSLLRSINRTVSLSAGSISLFGRDTELLSRREIARLVAVVAQENETKFPVSVLEYVLGGRFAHQPAFGFENEKDLDAAEDAICRCNLRGFEHRLMNELSGGERQRAVLARALATEASLLLLDEPSANLDPANQGIIFRLVRSRSRECGGSAIVITHDPNLASQFADRILLLHQGRVLADGQPEIVLSNELIKAVYGIDAIVDKNPVNGKPRITLIY